MTSRPTVETAATRTLAMRCRAVQMLILDVDGVLTEGLIPYAAALGQTSSPLLELKHFHVRDGAALRIWERAGKQAAIITGRSSSAVVHRAAEVGIHHVLQGAAKKELVLEQLLQQTGLADEQVAYLGDDLPDVPVLRRVGLAVAVNEACPEALAVAHFVPLQQGGRGAVRETIELILRCQGLWPRE